MAISFVGGAVGSASPNATFQVTLPGGTQLNDLVIVTFAVGDTGSTDQNLAVTGYTEVSDLFANDTNTTDMFVGYAFHNGTDTLVPQAAGFTAVGGTNASNAAVVMVFRGVKLVADGGPFDVTSTTATGINGGSPDPPSINTSGAAGIWTVIAGATGYAGTGTTYTAPTNYTTDFTERDHQDTVDVHVAMGYNSAPGDPEDPAAMTIGGGSGTAANNSWCATTMALSPAPPRSLVIPRPPISRITPWPGWE